VSSRALYRGAVGACVVALVGGGCSSPLEVGGGSPPQQRDGIARSAPDHHRMTDATGRCRLAPSLRVLTVGEGCGWALVTSESAPNERRRLELQGLALAGASTFVPVPAWCDAPAGCTVAAAQAGEQVLLRFLQPSLAPEGAATREGVWVSPMPGVQAATELADPWLGEGWMDRGVFRGPTRRWRPHNCGGRVVFEESSHSSLPSMPGPRSTLHGDTFVVIEASAEGTSGRCSKLAFEDAVLLSPSP
jgi:hypothetical protein